jgi:anaerobic selenocysteine-containing dehydrogenase
LGERLTGTLAEEILTPGEGQIKALIVDGANIASSVPDKAKMLEALKSLELLVVIDPHLSATASLAHYVLPTTMQFERPDLPITLGFPLYLDAWSQYTPAIVSPPKDSEVVDDWYVFWSLARRLGLGLDYNGTPLDMSRAPTSDDLLTLGLRNATISMEDLKRQPNGIWRGPAEGSVVLPARSGAAGRFTVLPDDVKQEVAGALADESALDGFAFRLAVRRSRDLNGSMGHQTPSVRQRNPYNPLFISPRDMIELGLEPGDWVAIHSEVGSITAIAATDPGLRRGVVSMSHNWGYVDNDPGQYRQHGASVNFLIRNDRHFQTINAMPRMTAIPVNVVRLQVHGGIEPLPADATV